MAERGWKMFVKAKDLFKDGWEDKRIVFCVVEDDVQTIALRKLGRSLTEEELGRASRDIEEGLSEGLGVVIETAIQNAIRG